MLRRTLPLIVTTLTLSLSACAGASMHPGAANACAAGLSSAYAEMKHARAQGFDGSVDLTKAAALLTAAKIQQQFGKYPNCIDKVRRARNDIFQAQAHH